MRKHIVLAIAALVTPILAAIAVAGAGSDEERAVREAVDLYFQGHATGSGEPWRKAFYPDAKLFWVKDGQITQRTSADGYAESASRSESAGNGCSCSSRRIAVSRISCSVRQAARS